MREEDRRDLRERVALEGWQPSGHLRAGSLGKGVGSAGGVKSAGMMPAEEGDGRQGHVSQGPEPGGDQGDESLQRALEKEVMNQLHEENMKLKQLLSEVQQSKGTGTTSTSEWSEVSGSGGVQEPARRPQAQKEERRERIMFTPNGTRVPSQPPPLDRDLQVSPVGFPEMPPWPASLWLEYENEDRDRKRIKRLGAETFRPTKLEGSTTRTSWPRDGFPTRTPRGLSSSRPRDEFPTRTSRRLSSSRPRDGFPTGSMS